MPHSEDNDPAQANGRASLLIREIQAGSKEASSKLFVLLRDELHRIASGQMRKARAGHTLQATALLNEAWVRLMGTEVAYADQAHFLAAASKAMRSVLVDHARRNRALKRGGDRDRVSIDTAVELFDQRAHDLVDLDDALQALASERERQAKIVELRFFAGLSIEDVARVLKISTNTVDRDWRMARLWLLDRLGAA